MNKIQLTLNQILWRCATVLMISDDAILDMNNGSKRLTEDRYITWAVMEKAGYTHQQIADHFKVNRETVTKGLSKLDGWMLIYRDLKGNYNRLMALVLKEV